MEILRLIGFIVISLLLAILMDYLTKRKNERRNRQTNDVALPPILSVHWGDVRLSQEFNHEVWHTCANCGEIYDARLEMGACPKCKQRFNLSE